jgi:hypothetical protein
MKRIFRFMRSHTCACAALFLATAGVASATTLNLPSDGSEAMFSIQSPFPDTLTLGPVVTVNPDGCPGGHCTNSFWTVNLTVDFFDASHALLASDTAIVSESCTPTNCTVPKIAYFSIPLDAQEFDVFNDVIVGGGWTYNAGSEFINAGSQIAETPIPNTIFLFAAGLSLLAFLSWRHKPTASMFLN